MGREATLSSRCDDIQRGGYAALIWGFINPQKEVRRTTWLGVWNNSSKSQYDPRGRKRAHRSSGLKSADCAPSCSITVWLDYMVKEVVLQQAMGTKTSHIPRKCHILLFFGGAEKSREESTGRWSDKAAGGEGWTGPDIALKLLGEVCISVQVKREKSVKGDLQVGMTKAGEGSSLSEIYKPARRTKRSVCMLVKWQHFGLRCYFCQCQSVTLIPSGDDTHLKRPSFKNEETHDGYNLTRGLFFSFWLVIWRHYMHIPQSKFTSFCL